MNKTITLTRESRIKIPTSEYLKSAVEQATIANKNNDGKTVVLIVNKLKTLLNSTRNEVLEILSISTTRFDKLREIRLCQEKIDGRFTGRV